MISDGVGTAGPDVALMETPPAGITPPSHPGGRGGFLDEVVLDLGYAEKKTVDWAVEQSRIVERPIGDVLVGGGILTEGQLSRVIAELHGLDHVDLGAFEVDLDVARLISRQAARRYKAVPVAFAPDGALMLALADPVDPLAVSDIAVMTRSEVRPMVASASEIDSVVEQLDDAVTRPVEPDVGADAESAAEADPPASEPHSEELAAERDALRKVVEGLAEELDAVRAEADGRTEELGTLRKAVVARTAERDALLNGRRAELQGERAEIERSRAGLQGERAEVQRERTELEGRQAEIDRERIESLRADLDQEREERDDERTEVDPSTPGTAERATRAATPEERDADREELGSLELALGAELARALDDNERLERRIITVLASAAEISAARGKLARLD